jgi:predicted metal-dependent HD superfamily phosphohydrolase
MSIVVTDIHLLAIAEQYVTEFYRTHISEKYVYHDLAHTQSVVRICQHIGQANHLTPREFDLLVLAAWFHDTGYAQGPEQHEERSAANVAIFLQSYNFPSSDIAIIQDCIRATKVPQKPTTLLEQIICDADLSHLGEKTYWERCARVREELIFTQNRVMTEKEWVEFELTFMLSHQYHTQTAKELFDERKLKHINQLRKQKSRLNPHEELTMDDIFILEKQKDKDREKKWKLVAKQTEQEAKRLGLGRGVETMYRTTYNTHNNLSALADHKANLMLSVNTIMISITLSMLVPKLTEAPQLILPTVVLLCVCLSSIVFATLATRPKVTTGEVTLEDIRQKRSNLLFFGNFHNMKLEDFQWGMMEMIKDTDFQYSSMTRDLYFLGKVLSQKYKYLTYCYNIFMFGLIASVLLFAIAFMMGVGVTFPTKIK